MACPGTHGRVLGVVDLSEGGRGRRALSTHGLAAITGAFPKPAADPATAPPGSLLGR